MVRINILNSYSKNLWVEDDKLFDDSGEITLSQIGTFIVHRLINRYDKESVENACSAANRSALSFLPVLGRGEAILLGVDLPMPISVRVKPPARKPSSKTPPVIPAIFASST
jgi:DNA helicase HerA-like ATPase